MPVAAILAWAVLFVSGTLLLKMGGSTIEHVVEDVKETVQDVVEVPKKALNPMTLLLLVVGAAIVMGVFPKIRK